VGSSIVKTGRPPFAQAAIRLFCKVATQSLLLCTGGSAKPDDATAHGLPPHSAPLIPREAGQRTSKDWIHQVTVSQSAPTRLTKIREFSAEVRKSEAVALGDPVMPVFDGRVVDSSTPIAFN
jgi:hypothetical protein